MSGTVTAATKRDLNLQSTSNAPARLFTHDLRLKPCFTYEFNCFRVTKSWSCSSLHARVSIRSTRVPCLRMLIVLLKTSSNLLIPAELPAGSQQCFQSGRKGRDLCSWFVLSEALHRVYVLIKKSSNALPWVMLVADPYIADLLM